MEGLNSGNIMKRHKRVARQPKSFFSEAGFRYPGGALMAVRLPVANTAEWDLWYRNNTLQKYLNL
jgi:predicted alpha/beta hydrolase